MRDIYNSCGMMPSIWSENFHDRMIKEMHYKVKWGLNNDLNNEIIDVNVIVSNKVVEVTFIDGDKQKAVCQEPDVFSLEQAISICLTKHMLGGTGAYNKVVKNGVKVYKENQKEMCRIKAEEELLAKRRAKRAEYMKRRANRRREEQIEIQKEAYIRALREVEKVNVG